MLRIGHGFDAHRIAEGRRLVLGGVEIDFGGKGLLGHSDADVVTHAVCDALLGAAALGDIGKLFPDTDEKFKNVASLELLANVIELLGANSYTTGNIDVTVAAQAPRLAPHINAMREKLAKVCSVGPGAISIKATTTEGMGFTGRGEGIAAWAVATIMSREP